MPRRATPSALGLLLSVATAFLLCAASGHARAAEPELVWETTFLDEFEGEEGQSPSPANWRFSIGHGYPGGPPNWGTGEIAYHTADPANVSVDGSGLLRITPLRDAEGNWTSARIETNRADFRPPEGGVMSIEARIALPAVTGFGALGYWPAFWGLGAPYRESFGWPGVGEFDVMENVNGVNTIWGVLHCGTPTGGPCDEPGGVSGTMACSPDRCAGSFHTYRFEWDASITPNELRWYVDGQQYHSVSEADLPPSTWAEMASHEGFFLILNVAIGGGFPSGVAGFETPTAATEPGHPMTVDYVVVRYGRHEPGVEVPVVTVGVMPRARVVGPRKRRARYRLEVRNASAADAGELRICARTKRRRLAIRGPACRAVELAGGERRTERVRLRIKRAARGRRTRIRFVATGEAIARQTVSATLRVKRR